MSHYLTSATAGQKHEQKNPPAKPGDSDFRKKKPALWNASALLAALLAALATRRLILLPALLLPALAALLVLLIAWIRHQIYSLGELRLTPHSGETFLTTLMPSCRHLIPIANRSA